jgi:hypothetical protein
VTRDTIIYGSSDGGKTTYAETPEISEKMDYLGNLLNLEKHTVGGTPMAVCGDIEIHKGSVSFFFSLFLFLGHGSESFRNLREQKNPP